MGVLYANVDGNWTPVIGTPQAPLAVDEVYVGPNDPRVDPLSTHELWFDTVALTLNAWVNGAWLPAGGAVTVPSEVWIGPNDPTPLLPETEMWYDPDAVLRDAPSTPTGFDTAMLEIAKLQARVIQLEKALKTQRPRPHQQGVV